MHSKDIIKKEFKPNSITNEFTKRVTTLLNSNAYSESEIIKMLEWNKSPFSLVKNGKRNIPPAKWDLFQSVFKNENKNKQETSDLETWKQHYNDMKELALSNNSTFNKAFSNITEVLSEIREVKKHLVAAVKNQTVYQTKVVSSQYTMMEALEQLRGLHPGELAKSARKKQAVLLKNMEEVHKMSDQDSSGKQHHHSAT